MASGIQIKSDFLILALKENREELNQRFLVAKSFSPNIEKEELFFYISEILEPISLKCKSKETVFNIVLPLYESILNLLSKNIIGEKGRYPFFENSFYKILTGCIPLLEKDPNEFTARTANAILKISQVSIKSLNGWINDMILISEETDSVNDFFEAGKIAAWKNGIAHYREGALEILSTQRKEIIKKLFNLTTIDFDIKKLTLNLINDPWVYPSEVLDKPKTKTRLFSLRFGNFRGFGGEFISPPITYSAGNKFLMEDKKDLYHLYTDVFGTTLISINKNSDLDFETDKSIRENFSDDTVKFSGFSAKISDLKSRSSSAIANQTLCTTLSNSHSVYIFGAV